MQLSVTAKESIKTALAMTVAYGIALLMDWDTPMWAGFSVAFVSLPMTGHSFNKSAMRLLGTMVAAIASLSIISLFPQHRWLFISALCVYVGFFTYMMGAAKYQYFWYVCGYVCIIVSLEAGPDSVNAFNLAVLRTQETALGILVYSVIAATLWHRNSVDDFNAAAVQLSASQHDHYRQYIGLIHGQDAAEEVMDLAMASMRQQALFKESFSAAMTDSYEIKRLRAQWQQYQDQLSKCSDIMACRSDVFSILEEIENHVLTPGLQDLDRELEQRFEQIVHMLEDKIPTRAPQIIKLNLDKAVLKNLTHTQQSALHGIHATLLELEQVSRALYNAVSEIKGFSSGTGIDASTRTPAPTADFVFDIDRLASVVQITAVLWLTFLAFIYVNDLPGGIFLIVISGVIGMSLAAKPASHASSMYIPFATSVLFCSVLYALVMPQLSSFIGLGSMIFVVTFLICYRYSTPQQGMGRAAGLAVFVTMISVENHQTYNILLVFNTILVFTGMFIVFQITAYIPYSPRPEKAFMRLQKRFFRSCEYLISTLANTQVDQLSFWERRKQSFHFHEVKTLPAKIQDRSGAIDAKLFPGSSKEHISAISAILQLINIRIQNLLDLKVNPRSQLLIDSLFADSQTWRTAVQEAFQNFSKLELIDDKDVFRSMLSEEIVHFEARVEAALKAIEPWPLKESDNDNFYHLLGAYRGVSDALLEYSGKAKLIDWVEWHEARF